MRRSPRSRPPQSRSPQSRSPTRREPEQFSTIVCFKLFLAIFTMLIGVILALCLNVFERSKQEEFTKLPLPKPSADQDPQVPGPQKSPRWPRAARPGHKPLTARDRIYFFVLKENYGPFKTKMCLTHNEPKSGEHPLNIYECKRGDRAKQFEHSPSSELFQYVGRKRSTNKRCIHVNQTTTEIVSRSCSEKPRNNKFRLAWNPSKLREKRTGLCIRGIRKTNKVEVVDCKQRLPGMLWERHAQRIHLKKF